VAAIQLFVITYFYVPTHFIDHKICHFWMRLTGHGRRSYFVALCTALILKNFVYNYFIKDYLISGFTIFLIGIYAFVCYLYSKWLRNPAIGLDTIEMKKVYYRIPMVRAYVFITCFHLALLLLLIPLVFSSPALLGANLIAMIIVNTIWCAYSQSGPPQPDNTFWQQAKSKIRSVLESNRKPVFTPIPVGT